MKITFYVICHFSLVTFNILSLSLIFVSLITLCPLSIFCSVEISSNVLQVVYLCFSLNYSAMDSFKCAIHFCLFFSSSRSLVNTSCIFFIVFLSSWIIFTIIILNSFSERLPLSTSFSCFSGVLSCPFIWDLTFCFFILFNTLMWLLF